MPCADLRASTSTCLARSIISHRTLKLPLSPSSHSNRCFSGICSISVFMLIIVRSRARICDSMTPKCFLNSAGHFACNKFFMTRSDAAFLIASISEPIGGMASLSAFLSFDMSFFAFLMGFTGRGALTLVISVDFLMADLGSFLPFLPLPLPIVKRGAGERVVVEFEVSR